MDAQFSTMTRIKDFVGPQGWTEDPDLIAPHLIEWRDRWSGSAPILLMPASTSEAQMIISQCNEAGLAVTTQGGNTGLVGAQIPKGEVLISTKRLNAIRSVDPVDDAIVA
jgi:FAD/FMN-containing dehydrogenase